jgi:hypothetical protein
MTEAERAQAELDQFYGTSPLPASNWQTNRERTELETFNSGGFNGPAASQEEAAAREEAAKAHARAAMERVRAEPELEPVIPPEPPVQGS